MSVEREREVVSCFQAATEEGADPDPVGTAFRAAEARLRVERAGAARLGAHAIFSAAEAGWLSALAAFRGLAVEAEDAAVEAMDTAERAAADAFMRTHSPDLYAFARKIWAIELEATEVSLGRESHTLIGWLAAIRIEVLSLADASSHALAAVKATKHQDASAA